MKKRFCLQTLPAAPKSGKKYKKKSILKKKILFMDDQPNIREFTGQMLSIIGYEVELAKDGFDAVDIYEKAKKYGSPFDMVVLDLKVPGGIGGMYVINKLLEIDPQVKAIITNEYTQENVMTEYKKYGFAASIVKPLKMEALSNFLFEVGLGCRRS